MKCMDNPSRIIPPKDIGIPDSFSYEEIPIKIIDCQVRRLKYKEVASAKVLWRIIFVRKIHGNVKRILRRDTYISLSLEEFQIKLLILCTVLMLVKCSVTLHIESLRWVFNGTALSLHRLISSDDEIFHGGSIVTPSYLKFCELCMKYQFWVNLRGPYLLVHDVLDGP